MKSQELSEWADSYIEAQGLGVTDVNHPLWWSIDQFFDLCHENPDACWQGILAVLARNPSERVLGNLAAGPLEDLIHYHGPAFIDRIEFEAREDPDFKQLLCGVWESSAPEIWARVQRARGKA